MARLAFRRRFSKLPHALSPHEKWGREHMLRNADLWLENRVTDPNGSLVL